ncbi:MAG: hypothetical protein CMP22_05185 [Rickettsiales bacterium]|nr:hypothetical protein [Rickettsiales bacterium]|tara:strand:+ start:252 stop:980 length:729 start_codon:yes stop_codon:yes gene_type:complete
MPSQNKPIVTTNRYEELIRGFIEAGYEFKAFGKEAVGKTMFLRHDIDFCLHRALEVAKTNKKLGVTGTFFIMASGFAYNLLDKENQDLVRQIRDNDQIISLHYDPTVYDDIQRGFEIEKNLFDGLFEEDIKVISIHRPGPFLDENNTRLGECEHTYMDKYFNDIKYCSDSGGRFKYGHPYETEAFKSEQPIHLLLHPVWWTHDLNTPTEFLLNWQEEVAYRTIDKTLDNCKTFDKKAFWETA